MHQDEKKYQEAKLLGLLADDSEYAFQLIYDHYRNQIYQLAISYLKSPVLAQEAVQDVFLKLWFSRKKMNKNLSLEPWLLIVARNHLINQLKSIAHHWLHLPEEGLLSSWEDNKIFDNIQYKEYKQQLSTAIDLLSDNQKKVFLLAREEGMTHAQIAEALRMSPLTVKTHMARALRFIRQYLKDRRTLSAILL